MLTPDFNNEIGTLIRSLQQRVLMEPVLMRPQYTGEERDAIERVDQAIITLIAIRIHLMQRPGDAT